MSSISRPDNAELSLSDWDWIDRRVKLFERTWHPDDPQRFAKQLHDAGELRQQLLVELLHADLEFSLRGKHIFGVDSYLQIFPELTEQSSVVANLVMHEWKMRQAYQPDLSLDELLTRYPALRNMIAHEEMTSAIITSTSSHDNAALPPSPNPILPRTLPEERDHWPTIPGYELVEILGRGGMGIVYRAIDLQLKRDVAIKMLLKGALATSQEQARFRHEAEVVAALQHPQVLQVYQIGEHEGQPYLVLEFAACGSLARQLAGRPIDARRAAATIRGLTEAVAKAHAANIVHRDLKPANVLIDATGLAKIADFGLAKRIALDLDFTKEDLLICTPSYAAPERMFETDTPVTPAVDIYSLGAVLFEMLTGRPPFVGTSILEVLEQVRCGDPIAPHRLVSSTPRDLETICLKCLERDPTKRYQSATALAEDLERFVNGWPVLARPISAPARLVRWVRRNPMVASLSTISAILLLGISVASLVIASVVAKSAKAERELRETADRAKQLAMTNEQRAIAEAAAANESIHFIQELFAATDIARATPDDLEASAEPLAVGVQTREIVELSIARLQNSLHAHPLARARVLTTVGATALSVGMVAEARPLLSEAVELYRDSGQGESLAASEAMTALARVEATSRNYSVAFELFDRSSAVLKKLSLADSLAQADIDVYRTWMGLAWKQRNFVSDCLRDVERAVDIRRKHLGEHHPQTVLARTIATLASALVTEDRVSAVRTMESLWEEIQDVPLGNFIKGIVLDEIAIVHQRLGDSAKATLFVDQSLERMHRAFGDHDHPVFSEILSDAAWIAHSCGDILATAKYQEQALLMRARCVGEDNETWELRTRLVDYLGMIGEHQKARQVCDDFPPTASPRWVDQWKVEKLLRENRLDEAFSHQQSVLASYTSAEWTSMVELSSFKLAEIEILRGNCQAAIDLYDSWQVNKLRLPADIRLPDFVFLPWDTVLEQCDATEKAAAYRADFHRMLERYTNDLPQFHADNWPHVYRLVVKLGDSPLYKEQLLRCDAGWLARKHPRHVCVGAIKYALAEQYMRAEDFDTAVGCASEAVSILQESLGNQAEHTIQAQDLLKRLQKEAAERLEG